MKTHMQREINVLRNQLLELGGDVNSSLNMTYKALLDMDKALANKVIKADQKINDAEIIIEENALKILALYQPVASDLREVVSFLKINNDLERVGDLCSNICRYIKKSHKAGPIDVPDKLQEMFPKVLNMMNLTIDCAYKDDIETVIQVCELDNSIDALNKSLLSELKEKIQESPEMTDQLLYYFSISRTLERIADYFTNICEDIYYKVTGSIVRHSPENMILEDED